MKEGTPDKNDFKGWKRHLEVHFYNYAGIAITGAKVSYSDDLKVQGFKLIFVRDELDNMKQSLSSSSVKFCYDEMFQKLYDSNKKKWQIDVMNYFDRFREYIETLSKDQKAFKKQKQELRAFGAIIAIGTSPKAYTKAIPVIITLMEFMDRREWPNRSDFSNRLKSQNFRVPGSSIADYLMELGCSDFVRDTQKG